MEHLGQNALGRVCMRLVAAIICCLTYVSLAFAQSDRSTITGTISDQSGAVVANAPVEARNLPRDWFILPRAPPQEITPFPNCRSEHTR